MTEGPLALQIQRLVDEALAAFDSSGTTVSALVRKAQRIAMLRGDYAKQVGLILQTTEFVAEMVNSGNDPDIPAYYMACQKLATLVGAEESLQEVERQFRNYLRTRRIGQEGVDGSTIVSSTVSQLEDNLDLLERAYEDAKSPGEPSTQHDVLVALQDKYQVMSKVRQDVYDYLVSVEMDVVAGKPNSDIFQRAQAYINESLRRFAPDALEKFVAAQDRLSSGSSEDYAYALTSCRRVIKDLADALYPATGEDVEGVDGAMRRMSDDRYKNRLTEYVRQNVGAKRHKQTVVQVVTDLYSRLNALDGLASKGVHDDVTQAEAETCVVWTYMLAGDIVRIADGTSTFLVSDAT